MSTISASTTSTTAYKVTADTTGTLVLQTGSSPTTALTIDGSQNVGIGTSSPSTRLHVSSATSSTILSQTNTSGTVTYNMTGANLYIDSSVSSFYAFRNQAGTESLRIDTTGALQVGTTATAVGTKANFYGTTTVLDSGGQLFVGVTDSIAADKGGQIMMGAYYTGTTMTSMGGIAAKRENASSGNYAGYLQFITSTNGSGNTEKARFDSGGNFIMGATSLASGLGSDRAFQLTANSYVFGTSQSNGVVTFTKSIPDNTATTFLTVANIDNWAGTILISYVRNADQNRSGMKLVRYAYNRTFSTLLTSDQNSGSTFSVSGNNLQVTIGGSGTYLCQFTIWGGSV